MKLFQLTNRDGSNLGQPMTGEQINETLLAALEEIEQLKNPWISVEDELPPFHKEILFYVNDQLGIMKGEFYRNSHKFKSYFKYTEAVFYKDEVTHWMPLPKLEGQG